MKRIRIGLLVALVLALLAITFVAPIGTNSGEEDLVVYWSAARLWAGGKNPYDPESLLALQRQLRPERTQYEGRAFASWNPPWLLVILWPLALLPFDLAARAWILCNIGMLALSSVIAWRQASASWDNRGILLVLLAALLFGESLLTIKMGQITGLVVLGLVLGMWSLTEKRDGLAGAVLLLATVKPHLVYLVLALIGVWAVSRRRWRILGGLAGAGLVSMLLLWAVFPGWPAAYLAATLNHPFSVYATATVGSLLHAALGTDIFRWAGAALLPLAPWLARLADRRGWPTAVNVALLISLPLAPYGFAFDQVVLLPAIVQVLAWLWQRQLPGRSAWIVGGGLAAVYVILLWMLIAYSLPYYWFVWVPLALGLLYAVAWSQRVMPQRRPA